MTIAVIAVVVGVAIILAASIAYGMGQIGEHITPFFWTGQQIKNFRRKVRKHNQIVNFGIDPECVALKKMERSNLTEAKPTAKCPHCDGEAEFKWMIVNPFREGLTYPEMYCPKCNKYFTVRKDI